MSFFKKLFGGGSTAAPAPVEAEAEEYKGFTIRPAPYQADGQYQTAGVILKTVDGVLKEHRFVRADRFAGREEAEAFARIKGRLIVDEQGDRLFG